MDAWSYYSPPRTTGCLPCRDRVTMRQALEASRPDLMPELEPREGRTYCNVYLNRATKALSAEIPYWYLGQEFGATAQINWLMTHGTEHGWGKLRDMDAARQSAAMGMPTVATWRNPGQGSSHVAVVLDSPDTGPVHVAQAGASNLWDAEIQRGFGQYLPEVVYWSHP